MAMTANNPILEYLKTGRLILRQAKPLFWPVSMVPYYMAWCIGSGKVYPTYFAKVLYLPDPAPVTNIYSEVVLFFLGLIAIGPFMAGATLLYNDYWDLKVDEKNRRKTYLPLLRGLVEPRTVLLSSVFLFGMAMVAAFFISYWFLFFMGIVLLLSLAYSGPPLRLKEKPGIDVVTNAIGAGVICSLAGWSMVADLSEYPILWGVVSFFGVGAIYFPTTLIDYEPDVKNGVTTIATVLGKKRIYYLGMASVVIANSLIILMCFMDYIIDTGFLLFAVPIVIAQVGTYWYFLRQQNFKGGYRAILVLSIFLLIGNVLLLFYHAGILSV